MMGMRKEEGMKRGKDIIEKWGDGSETQPPVVEWAPAVRYH